MPKSVNRLLSRKSRNLHNIYTTDSLNALLLPTGLIFSLGFDCRPTFLQSLVVAGPVLSPEVFERQIPAPDLDIAELWEEVRTKAVLIEQSSRVASGFLSYLSSTTEPAELSPQTPKLRIPGIGILDNSNVATELHIEDISSIPQFDSSYPTNQEQTEDVRSSQFLEYRRTFELVNRVVLGYNAETNGKLVRQPVPQDTSPDKEPLDHIRPKLHHLRFKESSEKSQYVQKRHISLDVSTTFASVNYRDILEPSVILDFDKIGADFLFILGPKDGNRSDVHFGPDVERDARSMLSMHLRMRYLAP